MSVRQYKVAISDNSGISIEFVKVNALFNPIKNAEEYEFIYAMRELVDDILDLKMNEAIYFQSNRDDKTTKGIIHRCD